MHSPTWNHFWNSDPGSQSSRKRSWARFTARSCGFPISFSSATDWGRVRRVGCTLVHSLASLGTVWMSGWTAAFYRSILRIPMQSTMSSRLLALSWTFLRSVIHPPLLLPLLRLSRPLLSLPTPRRRRHFHRFCIHLLRHCQQPVSSALILLISFGAVQ